MTPEEIFQELSNSKGLPVEALKAASECRETMVPLFCAEIEKYLSSPVKDRLDPGPNPIFFAFHLLGEWREKSAYRILARLLDLSSDEMEVFLGDAKTETTHRVMAAVFDEDAAPLFNIILNEKADEFCRSRMCETLVMLVRDGLLSRDAVVSFLREAFDKLNPRGESNFVWNGWAETIAMMGLEELKPLVMKAFEAGAIDLLWRDEADYEKDLAYGIEHPYQSRLASEHEYAPWTDTIEEFSTWAFAKKSQEDSEDEEADDYIYFTEDFETASDEDFLETGGQHMNPYRHVGRNDPCPCESGKKFKKCCGRSK